MYIELDDYATNRVMNNFDPETQVILFAVEDGISPYNDPLDVTMETSFTINIVNKDVPYQRWFDMPLETSLGTWYIKSTSKSLLAENMQLRGRRTTLVAWHLIQMNKVVWLKVWQLRMQLALILPHTMLIKTDQNISKADSFDGYF